MSSKHKDNLHILRSILIESLPRENLPLDIEYGVNNNMTDQVNENTSRPGSAQNAPPLLLKTPSKADQQRLEKIQQLREKQNSDRLKKLEELKLHAAAASKLREEQDTRRRRHFLELSKKDSERRQAAEERRQQLEKERMSALTARFESKRMNASMTASMMSQPRSNDRKYAFGSCTPRLIENMDGFLWKSQYNLNLNPPPGAGTSDNKQGRATSAQDLLAGNDDGGSQSRLYFFCGRRKTDLTPTIPIRRDMQSPRSTTTSDLDIRVHNHSGFARTPSPGPRNILHQRSKSTNQLFKLTRTELLRQERAKKREGFSSTMSTRPPSSLSAANTSVMTSSAHSGVNINMRSRPAARKPRPVSVHVTGISSNTPTTAGAAMDEKRFSKIEEKNLQKSSSRTPTTTTTTTTPRPRVSAANATTTAEQKSAKSPSPTTEEKSSSLSSTSNNNKKDFITSTIKRGTTPKPKKTTETTSKSNNNNITSNGVAVVVKDEGGIATKRQQAPPQHPSSGGGENVSTSKSIIVDSVTDKSDSDEKTKSATISVLEQDNAVVPNNSAVVVEPEIEQAVKVNGLSKGEGDEEEKVGVIETVVVANNNNGVREQNGERGDVILNNNLNNNNYNNDNTPGGGGDGDNMSTSTTTTATPTTTATEQNEEMLLIPSNKTPKLSNEQQAKAALAEKRRLAREAQEKEAARLEELARQEEERQREEAELAERLLEESKKAEEERLMKAIREREQREEEERKRQIEEENSRLEKEQADKEAAREVERLRLEMEERLRREEIERVERRRRVEAIMSRTRVANRKNQENKQDNLQEEEDSASVIPTTKSDPTTIMNLQNSNFNNNTTTSTLISFDDNEFNCNTNNRTVQQEEQIDGAFRTSAMEGSTTSGSAEIQDLLS